jgi:cellobiose-specific phosphotransferase system component IIB
MNQDTNRATGRTTGLMLQSIGKAIENPGTEVEFIDHHAQNHAQLQYCKERIEKIAKQLNLDVSVWHKSDWKLLVKSNWVSPYAQRTPAEEAFKENYGVYPSELATTADFDCWKSFKRGFEAAQND